MVKCPLMHFYQWTQNKTDKGEQDVVIPGNPGGFHFYDAKGISFENTWLNILTAHTLAD